MPIFCFGNKYHQHHSSIINKSLFLTQIRSTIQTTFMLCMSFSTPDFKLHWNRGKQKTPIPAVK